MAERQIKFRGKRIDNGEWAYGCLFQVNNVAYILLAFSTEEYGSGYSAAASDADDPTQGGIQTVLTSMAESIKDIERKKYIDGIFTWYLHSCSWELQCEIARLLLEEYQPFIPPLLIGCVPAQLVDEIPSIMYDRKVSLNSRFWGFG